MPGSVGILLIPILVHLAMLLAQAAVGTAHDCVAVSAFFCGSPFEAIMSSFREEQNVNFFALAISLFTGMLQLVLGLFIFDYDILKAHDTAVGSAVGAGIQIIGAIGMMIATLAGAMAIFRR